MNLTKVTMTGADDSIRPEKLFDISAQYPFVEWGILASRNSKGTKRFPSTKWLGKLFDLNRVNNDYEDMRMQFSCHLCGSYVKELLRGDVMFMTEIGFAWDIFQRVQINTHGVWHAHDAHAMNKALEQMGALEYIFQYDKVNKDILNSALTSNAKCSALFDLSHGAGTLPNEWPLPLENISCGYAGGLAPHNIIYELNRIYEKVGDRPFWIDMETHIRSDNDQVFDLQKVIVVLEICKQHFVK